MGKTLVDVNMRESSDEDEEVQHVNPVSQSESTFPDRTITTELEGIVEMLREVPGAIGREMADHKISSRYKEKHFESLKREIDVVCSKVERLKANCQLTRVLHGELFKVLSERGIESEEDWAQYVSTIERDGDMLAELCDILNTDMLQIVDVVKDTKARAESCEAGRNGNVAQEPALDAIKNGADWTVLRARLEAMCGDVMGKPTRSNSSLQASHYWLCPFHVHDVLSPYFTTRTSAPSQGFRQRERDSKMQR
ncbi:hypothetical protein Y032_0120g912 [Ancylostoma ceylanicum]|uniref:Uncharacterized protein n=1 Tax=Ancylostoma ceylanicum TaxID=53326 RepID=A0A016TAM9_9BILA|nr:hypothetical protein Y032_0120g912 [Ancylostoma ceylanicum]